MRIIVVHVLSSSELKTFLTILNGLLIYLFDAALSRNLPISQTMGKVDRIRIFRASGMCSEQCKFGP